MPINVKKHTTYPYELRVWVVKGCVDNEGNSLMKRIYMVKWLDDNVNWDERAGLNIKDSNLRGDPLSFMRKDTNAHHRLHYVFRVATEEDVMKVKLKF
jgi:hypothetical protein